MFDQPVYCCLINIYILLNQPVYCLINMYVYIFLGLACIYCFEFSLWLWWSGRGPGLTMTSLLKHHNRIYCLNRILTRLPTTLLVFQHSTVKGHLLLLFRCVAYLLVTLSSLSHWLNDRLIDWLTLAVKEWQTDGWIQFHSCRLIPKYLRF